MTSPASAHQIPPLLSKANKAELAASISGLTKLTLHDPYRKILQLLPDWLNRLSRTLVELHLKGQCSWITPEVFNSIIPTTTNHFIQYQFLIFTPESRPVRRVVSTSSPPRTIGPLLAGEFATA
ncbi:hypothetical protein PQX77_006167 [Marasmius sp. AFHP31]|nr:hypothetical protein PQX77_006167 [Marasmius sp. AFHP31]